MLGSHLGDDGRCLGWWCPTGSTPNFHLALDRILLGVQMLVDVGGFIMGYVWEEDARTCLKHFLLHAEVRSVGEVQESPFGETLTWAPPFGTN